MKKRLAIAFLVGSIVLGAGTLLLIREPSPGPEDRLQTARSAPDPTPTPVASPDLEERKPTIVTIGPPKVPKFDSRSIELNRAVTSKQRPRAYLYMKASRLLSALEIHEREDRDPAWAPRMENTLRTRLSTAHLAPLGLEGMEPREVECRTSTCRVAMEWDESWESDLRESGVFQSDRDAAVMFHFNGRFGALARMTSVTQEPTSIGGGKRQFEKVLIFSEEEIDPETYAGWLAGSRVLDARRVSPPNDIRIPKPR